MVKERRGGRLPNESYRDREYLHIDEAKDLLASCDKFPMNKERNYWIIYFLLKHGLRVTELTRMKWNQVDLSRRLLTVKRLKSGITSTHQLSARQVLFLKGVYKKNWHDSSYVFCNPHTFEPINRMTIQVIVREAGNYAGLKMNIHPHMLRHSCIHHLLENENRDVIHVKDYAGHADIQSTLYYAHLSIKKHQDFFRVFEEEIGA